MGGSRERERVWQYWSLKDVRRAYEDHYIVTDFAREHGGPARYVGLKRTGPEVGFITPLSHNFSCESCNACDHLHGRDLCVLGQKDVGRPAGATLRTTRG